MYLVLAPLWTLNRHYFYFCGGGNSVSSLRPRPTVEFRTWAVESEKLGLNADKVCAFLNFSVLTYKMGMKIGPNSEGCW